MKKLLFFITLMLSPVLASAQTVNTQEYYPEGTKWTEIRLDTLKYDSWYSKVGDEWVPNFETIEYYVKGEYIKEEWDDQNTFKKVYTNGPEWTDSLTLLIQESDLYGHNSVMVSGLSHWYDEDYISSPAETYQFDWSVGKGLYYQDIVQEQTTYIVRYEFYYGIIDEIKEGYFGGVRPLKYVDLDGKAPECDIYDNPQKCDTNGGRIIQGIGITEWNDGECLFGAPNPYSALQMFGEDSYPERHYRSLLVHFERNGEVLYNVWPEKNEDSQQDNYIPFVEFGKQWHVVSAKNPNYVCRQETYRMFENVERAGKIYTHTICNDDVIAVTEETGLFREENRRVYKYDETKGRDIMLYDFSLKEGDIFTYEFGLDQPVNCKVLKQGWLNDGHQIVSSCTLTPADTLDIKYRRLRTWTIGRDNGVGEFVEVATWVEGIGALENMFRSFAFGGVKSCLAYVERKDKETVYHVNEYLPFSFCNAYDVMGQIHGCDLPTGAEYNGEYDGHHKLTYELEGDRLHVYGEAFTQCGPNNYAYFYERKTDDPSINKIEIFIREVEPTKDCMALHATNFYVPGFNPNMNYIIKDNNGEEHPVTNKTPQMAYRPFVEDGKVWKVGTISGNPVQMVDYYYFEGDTIVDGKTCKQMTRQRYVNPDYADYSTLTQTSFLSKVGAWYEENMKVYCYDAEKQSMRMMYDFSLNANDTLQFLNVDGSSPFIIGPRQTGGIDGFKGVYRDIMMCADEGQNIHSTFWLEGVGDINGPTRYPCNPILSDPVSEFLMSCTVGDEVIYLNDEYEDGATPGDYDAPKQHFDFNHTIKTRPKTPTRREAEQSLYGEYNNKLLGIHLDPLNDAYQVSITNESGKVVYEKTINAGNIVGLNIDISTYPKGRYTVTVENSQEVFTGEFEAQTTGIETVRHQTSAVGHRIYNLQGQRLGSLQKGLNIVNGQKIIVK